MKLDKNEVKKFINVIDENNQVKINNAGKSYMKYKNAIVTSYDNTTSLATVKFPDIEREYSLYNKTGELLEEHNRVKVEYTNNLSQGIITVKYGVWRKKEKEKNFPYRSVQFENTEDSEISEIVSSPLNLDFEVLSNESDTVITANQNVNVTQDGTINTEYFIDDVAITQKISSTLPVGKHTITHIVPATLIAGEHNLKIRQTSLDGKATSEASGLFGVVSGQVASAYVEAPPNDNLVMKINIAEDGETFLLPKMDTSAKSGLIYWGDGTSESYNSNTVYNHTYEKAGEYKIVITANIITIFGNAFSGDTGSVSKDKILEVSIPDTTVTIGYEPAYTAGTGGAFRSCTKLKTVKFGRNILNIYDGSFAFCSSLIGTLELNNITHLGDSAFRDTQLSKVILNAPDMEKGQSGSAFLNCTKLISVELNVPQIDGLMFRGCSALKNVTLHEGMTEIGAQAFRYCSSLTELVVPKSVTYLGIACLEGTSLKTLKLPSTLKENYWSYKDADIPSGCDVIWY